MGWQRGATAEVRNCKVDTVFLQDLCATNYVGPNNNNNNNGDKTGLICGVADSTQLIKDCVVSNSTVFGGSRGVAGIVGFAYGGTVIDNCKVETCNISGGAESVGGIDGGNYTDKNNCIIKNCTVSNSTISGKTDAGGICGGYSGQTITIENCKIYDTEIKSAAVAPILSATSYNLSSVAIKDCDISNVKLMSNDDTKDAAYGIVYTCSNPSKTSCNVMNNTGVVTIGLASDKMLIVDLHNNEKLALSETYSDSGYTLRKKYEEGSGVVYFNNEDDLSIATTDLKGKIVTAVLNGGTFQADTVFQAEKLATPVKKDEFFSGWYTNLADESTKTTVPVVGETYYAKWKDDNSSSGNCGPLDSKGAFTDSAKWAFDAKTGTLTISGHGAMADTMRNNDIDIAPWKDLRTEIVNLVIEEGVTSISASAFRETKITSINLPSTIIKIGNAAFYNIGTVSGGLTIPEATTQIDGWAFAKTKFSGDLTILSPSVALEDTVFYQSNLAGTLDLAKFSGDTIGSQNFEGNQFTGKLVIPSNVNKIEQRAFTNNKFTSVAAETESLALDTQTFADCENVIATDFTKVTNLTFGLGNNQLVGNAIYVGSQEIAEKINEVQNGSPVHYLPNQTFVAVTNGGTLPADTVFKADKLATPVKAGNVFEGWFDNVGTKVEEPKPGNTYYAKWTTAGELTATAEGFTGPYDGTFHSITVKPSSNDATILYSVDGGRSYTSVEPKFKNAGDYTVYYKVQKTGCLDVTGSVAVNISKIQNPVTITPSSTTIFSGDTVQFTVKAPDDVTINDVVCEGITVTKNTDGTFSAVMPATPGTYTFQVEASGDKINNSENEAICTVTVVNSIKATAEGYSGAYDGQEHGILVTITEGPKDATIRYSVDGGATYSSVAPQFKDAGAYTVHYKVQKEGCVDATGSAVVSISKIQNPVTITPSSASVYGGDSVKLTVKAPEDVIVNDVVCEGITVTKNADGTFSAVMPATSGTYTFKVAASGDKINNSENDATCTVTVVQRGSSGGSSGGSSSGSSSGSSVKTPGVGTVAGAADESIKTAPTTATTNVAAAKAVKADESQTLIVPNGTAVSGKDFTEPAVLKVPVDTNGVDNVNNLTLAKYNVETGKLEIVGGSYDAKTKTVTGYVDAAGDYFVVEKEGLKTMTLQIGNTHATLNNVEKTLDTAPSISQDRTMVPLRFVAEAFGAQVDWEEATKTVIITIGGKVLIMKIGEELEGFGAAPILSHDRTLVPISYISKQLGAKVIWVPSTKTVAIAK